MKKLHIFLCYRQVDGKEAAFALYKLLHQRKHSLVIENEPIDYELNVYFDQATPAISNWRDLHQPALEAARAMVVICTPGLYSRLEEEDWAHMEIDWWIKNRKFAPILIDLTSEGNRWVPEVVNNKWPKAQRIYFNYNKWSKSKSYQKSSLNDLMFERIIGGVVASEAQVNFQDLEIQRDLLRKSRRNLRIAILSLFITFLSTLIAIWLGTQANLSRKEVEKNLATKFLRQAEIAWRDQDHMSATVFSARALTLDDSPEIIDRFKALSYQMDNNIAEAENHFKNIWISEYNNFIDLNFFPSKAVRLARVIESKEILDNWLSLTQINNKHSYKSVLQFKGLTSRVEEEIRSILRSKKKFSNEFINDFIRLEAMLSNQAYYNNNNQEILKITSQLSSFYKKVFNSYPKEKLIKQEEFSNDWRLLQKELRRNEAIVDYFFYDGNYGVWILLKEKEPIRLHLGNTDKIHKEAQDFLSLCESSYDYRRISDFRITDPLKDSLIISSGAKLKKLIWDPIEKKLGQGIKTIYLSPDAILTLIPFGALPGQKKGSILWEDYVFAWLTSAQDLIRAKEVDINNDGILLMGASRSNHHNLSYIPGATIEVMEISKLFPSSSTVLVGEDATELNLREQSAGNRIIHIASHGWADFPIYKSNYLSSERDTNLNEYSNRFSYLNLNKETADAFLVSIDPSIKAGIALFATDKSDGFNDGILSAMEAAGLKLDSVDLVVLAGCKTLGKPREGDGFTGLIRSFREAGAKTVVASMFVIPDKTVVDFMVSFYKHAIKNRFDYPLALKEAALEMRRKGYGPNPWASFVVYGAIR